MARGHWCGQVVFRRPRRGASHSRGRRFRSPGGGRPAARKDEGARHAGLVRVPQLDRRSCGIDRAIGGRQPEARDRAGTRAPARRLRAGARPLPRRAVAALVDHPDHGACGGRGHRSVRAADGGRGALGVTATYGYPVRRRRARAPGAGRGHPRTRVRHRPGGRRAGRLRTARSRPPAAISEQLLPRVSADAARPACRRSWRSRTRPTAGPFDDRDLAHPDVARRARVAGAGARGVARAHARSRPPGDGRRADRPLQPALLRDAAGAGDPAAAAAVRRALAADGGSRQLQGSERLRRGIWWATACCAKSPTSCGARCASSTSARGTAGRSS